MIKFPQGWLWASKMKRRKRKRSQSVDFLFFCAAAGPSLTDCVLTKFCIAYVVVVWTSRSNDDIVTMFALVTGCIYRYSAASTTSPILTHNLITLYHFWTIIAVELSSHYTYRVTAICNFFFYMDRVWPDTFDRSYADANCRLDRFYHRDLETKVLDRAACS